MTRVKRQLLLIFSVPCLLLAILLAALAVRSYSVEDRIYWSRWKLRDSALPSAESEAHETAYWLMSERGRLALGIRTVKVPVGGNYLDEGYWRQLVDNPDLVWQAIHIGRLRVSTSEGLFTKLGFHWVDASPESPSNMPMRYREIAAPYWFLESLLMAAPIAWIILALRHRKRRLEETPVDEPERAYPRAA